MLVVDDNATNRRILEEMLGLWEMRPKAVAGGKAALQEMERAALEEQPYPLVLLDGNMPQMDGFAVAERIREQPRLAGASIMMLTSSARPGDRARCLELGVASHLSKPVKRSDLLDTILEVLARRPGGRPQRAAPSAIRRSEGYRRLRVLVAEDNVVNQQVVMGFLEEHDALEAIRLDLAGPDTLWEGEGASLELQVTEPDSDRPVAGASVVVSLVANGGPTTELLLARTDENGTLEADCEIPSLSPAGGALVVHAEAVGRTAEVRRPVRRRT